tara:strand:+ start:5284 stop:5526 length:243 start_codon:yes stop_codon:yes gene_type:complete
LFINFYLLSKKYLNKLALKIKMPFFNLFAENKMFLVLFGLAIFYLAYKMLSRTSKTEKSYRESIDKILNSDEHKVKGRFE